MKNIAIVTLTVLTGLMFAENEMMKQAVETQAQRYETRLEIQAMEYQDELVDVRQELAKTRLALRGKQFEFDMVTNRVEQLNKEIGEGGQHD